MHDPASLLSKWYQNEAFELSLNKSVITNLCSSDCIPTFCRRIFLLMSKKATASLSLSVWEYQLRSYSRDLTKVPESVEVCRMPNLHRKSLLYILNSSFLKHPNTSMVNWSYLNYQRLCLSLPLDVVARSFSVCPSWAWESVLGTALRPPREG